MAEDARQSLPGDSVRLRAPIVLAHEPAFRLGSAEFRPATRELLFSGQSTILEPRVMQFLIALHRAEGAVITKDDLVQACWSGRIVGDDAINRVVSRLRGIAEREAGGQFRVETITRVGYRLVTASGEGLVGGGETGPAPATPPDRGGPAAGGERFRFGTPRPFAIALAALLLLLILAGGWFWFHKPVAPDHGMTVRIAGFRPISADIPPSLRDSIAAELVAAFNADGVITVSTAPMPPPGSGPAYALDGTLYRLGNAIRVITRFTNQRSGVILWSDSVDYGADQLPRISHKIAVDAGTVVRCGLSGAATYRTSLPDPVLGDYMRYCQEYWSYGGTRTLRFAQRVAAALPDFSWGWSAVTNGYVQASVSEGDSDRAEALRAAGRQAADKALALDRNNSEALAHKAFLIDSHDWVGQEALFKSAIAAQPLDCGCEHYGYGLKLEGVGRLGTAIEQYRAATDMLALWSDSQLALARALVAADRLEQAKPYFQAAIDLSKNPHLDQKLAVAHGLETGDLASAIAALRSPAYPLSEDGRAALLAGYEALASGSPAAKAQAVRALLALPPSRRNETVALMLAALGAPREALQVASQKPWLFWRPVMRRVLDEPAFPAVAQQLGLIGYWRTSHIRPDICGSGNPPAFCRMI